MLSLFLSVRVCLIKTKLLFLPIYLEVLHMMLNESILSCSKWINILACHVLTPICTVMVVV